MGVLPVLLVGGQLLLRLVELLLYRLVAVAGGGAVLRRFRLRRFGLLVECCRGLARGGGCLLVGGAGGLVVRELRAGVVEGGLVGRELRLVGGEGLLGTGQRLLV